VNSNVQSSRLLTHSKFVSIDLTDDDLSPLSFAMLNVLQSLTNDSILIVKNCSEIDLNQIKDKTIFIFTTSRISSLVKKEIRQQPQKLFILGQDQNSNNEENYFHNSEDFIFELADELYRCYMWEVNNDRRSGNTLASTYKNELANQIHKQLKEIHRTSSTNNQSIISTETIIIWLKFNNKNDQIITNTRILFENIVSSFIIFDDCEECFGHLCTDEFNHSVFLIIDDNYKDINLATLQALENIKQIYRYDQSGIRLRLTYDLISHYNQLGDQCQDKKDFHNAKKLFLKARDLCQMINKL
jgi:hypothetical protein